MSELQIRPVVPGDVAQIRQFIVDLAVYEKEPDAVKASEADIHNSLFGENPRVFGLMCESRSADGSVTPMGFAVYFFNYSTWLGRHGVYLEDLYVSQESRGLGAGKALLKAVAQVAIDNDCGRYEWSVLKWNTPSIEFYEACGAVPLDEWVGYRMDRAAMEAFVTSG